MIMDELTIRLLFLVAGLVIGLILGYLVRIAQDTRAIRRDMEDGSHDGEDH